MPGTATTQWRGDVHAIRAVAVAMVVAYHLDVGVVRGGFVGVDAFFVVSGFVIANALGRELAARGTISLPSFWSRRVRRLFPSALIVLVASGYASYVLYPREDWPTLGTQFVASVVGIENWALAASRTDYLAQGAPSTPFENFWSLGVEEQFYLLWPLLLLAVWRVARARARRVVVVVVVVGSALSFTASAVLAQSASAYFWPQTRAWEFGVGILLAFGEPVLRRWRERLPATARSVVAASGWGVLVACGLLLTGAVPYPGAVALIPVAGTSLIIAARADSGPLGWGIRWAPIRWLGTVSYPLYLWHWPLVLLIPRVAPLPQPVRAVVVVALSLTLAQATHRLVEQPMMGGRLANTRSRTTFAVAAMAMSAALIAPAVGWAALTSQVQQDTATSARLQADGDRCFGAGALGRDAGCGVNGHPADRFTPSTLTAAFDVDPTWDTCQSTGTAARSCVVGNRGGTRVALIGDSHAHQWSSALIALAKRRNWELHLYVKGGCEFSRVRWDGVSTAERERCAAWNDTVDRSLASEAPYRYVFTSSRADLRGTPTGSDPAAQARHGYQTSWAPLIRRGATVIALRDTPAAGTGVQGCLDRNPVATCRISVRRAFGAPDYLFETARATRGTLAVDTAPMFCTRGRCPAVIGNVLVYRDSQHVTRTYISSLTSALETMVCRSASASASARPAVWACFERRTHRPPTPRLRRRR